jgi:Xaa-Pro aminopeptidase
MTGPSLTLHTRLKRLGVDAFLFNTSEATPALNVRYLSGFTGSDATVVITQSERHLFTDGRYKTQAGEEARAFRVHVVRSKLDAVARTLIAAGVRKLGIEGARLSYDFVKGLLKRIKNLEPVSLKRPFLDDLRARKDPAEKARIQRAADIATTACRQVIEAGLVGHPEFRVAAELEARFKSEGAEKIAFETIVAAGLRSALPHGRPSDRPIGAGELVIIDYGCCVDGYHSDETVTCITGKPTPAQEDMHRAVYTAHMRALEFVRPGVHVRAVDGVARRSIDESGFGKYFLHGLGHGVGLEIHEPPFLSRRGRGTLEEGMVFTIEPGVYIEGVGGVRLESLVYLGAQGPELLSGMPKDLLRVG